MGYRCKFMAIRKWWNSMINSGIVGTLCQDKSRSKLSGPLLHEAMCSWPEVNRTAHLWLLVPTLSIFSSQVWQRRKSLLALSSNENQRGWSIARLNWRSSAVLGHLHSEYGNRGILGQTSEHPDSGFHELIEIGLHKGPPGIATGHKKQRFTEGMVTASSTSMNSKTRCNSSFSRITCHASLELPILPHTKDVPEIHSNCFGTWPNLVDLVIHHNIPNWINVVKTMP